MDRVIFKLQFKLHCLEGLLQNSVFWLAAAELRVNLCLMDVSVIGLNRRNSTPEITLTRLWDR